MEGGSGYQRKVSSAVRVKLHQESCASTELAHVFFPCLKLEAIPYKSSVTEAVPVNEVFLTTYILSQISLSICMAFTYVVRTLITPSGNPAQLTN